jgi:UPF0755 protein
VRRLPKVVGASLLAAALAAALGFACFERALGPRLGAAEPVVFEVPEGATLAGVARRLEARGLVRAAWALEWWGRWQGLERRLHAGEYELSPALPAREVLRRITGGAVMTHRVVLPEGLTAREVALRLAEAGLVDAEALLTLAGDPERAAAFGVGGPTLEGYLFPETYQLPRGLDAEDVAGVLVSQFLRVWSELAPDAEAQGLSMREVATLASIVEKETGAPEERARIAGVFRNRLARGMRLESDPTVIYGIDGFDGNLRRAHLEDPDNLYNTYRIQGLPPGPIANPGADALRAVVRPERNDYLYFVSRGDGTHVFSRTHAEHEQAVTRFQRRGRR